MTEIVHFPRTLLMPQECRAQIVPFSRSGGRSMGGIERTVRTDLGWWEIQLNNIPLHKRSHWQTWDALCQSIGGRAGLVAVPVWAMETAPYPSGSYEAPAILGHDDDSFFSDGSGYQQDAISVVSVGVTPIGATVISLRIVNAEASLSGVRFSYQHALYQAGRVIEIDGDIWTMQISPSVRAPIPDGADLNFDEPTCLCHLADDKGMSRGVNSSRFEQVSVSFVEANDFWNLLALGLVT